MLSFRRIRGGFVEDSWRIRRGSEGFEGFEDVIWQSIHGMHAVLTMACIQEWPLLRLRGLNPADWWRSVGLSGAKEPIISTSSMTPLLMQEDQRY